MELADSLYDTKLSAGAEKVSSYCAFSCSLHILPCPICYMYLVFAWAYHVMLASAF